MTSQSAPSQVPSSRTATNPQAIALTELDLSIARQWRTTLAPEWPGTICETGKVLIFERSTMLVQLDHQNLWTVRYQDLSLESTPGAENDYGSLSSACKNPIFRCLRCLRQRELANARDNAVGACEWVAVRDYIEALPNGPRKKSLLRMFGKFLDELAAGGDASVSTDRKLKQWAQAAMGEFRAASQARVVEARLIERTAVAKRTDVSRLAAAFSFKSDQNSLYVKKISSGPRSLGVIELTNGPLIYVKASPFVEDPDPIGGITSFSDLIEAAQTKSISVGISDNASDDVRRLDANQIDALLSAIEVIRTYSKGDSS